MPLAAAEFRPRAHAHTAWPEQQLCSPGSPGSPGSQDGSGHCRPGPSSAAAAGCRASAGPAAAPGARQRTQPADLGGTHVVGHRVGGGYGPDLAGTASTLALAYVLASPGWPPRWQACPQQRTQTLLLLCSLQRCLAGHSGKASRGPCCRASSPPCAHVGGRLELALHMILPVQPPPEAKVFRPHFSDMFAGTWHFFYNDTSELQVGCFFNPSVHSRLLMCLHTHRMYALLLASLPMCAAPGLLGPWLLFLWKHIMTGQG